jgi:hypothetical protein
MVSPETLGDGCQDESKTRTNKRLDITCRSDITILFLGGYVITLAYLLVYNELKVKIEKCSNN